MNYQVLEMKFKSSYGKQVVLTCMDTYPNQLVSSQSMRSILRHEDIEWVVECFISYQGSAIDNSQHLKDIKVFLKKYERIFGDLPPRRPPNRGVEHVIELKVGTLPIMIRIYKHPKILKY